MYLILPFLPILLPLLILITIVRCNERPSNGRSNHAVLSCHETRTRNCWGNGRGVNCGSEPAANYDGQSVDPNGFLAGAYGTLSSDEIPGGCPHIAAGAHFTARLHRSYDNWKTQQIVKLNVQVVDTNGWLTLNTKLNDGGGCNLPVTSNTGNAHYREQAWTAEGTYDHHCW